jgi:hypothetical protein
VTRQLEGDKGSLSVFSAWLDYKETGNDPEVMEKEIGSEWDGLTLLYSISTVTEL